MNNNDDDEQEVGAPFQDELDAAEAKDKEALSQHLQYVDKVTFLVTIARALQGVACQHMCFQWF